MEEPLKYGIRLKKISKKNLRYLPELSEDDVNVILTEFNTLKSASKALNIPEVYLKRLMIEFKYNEFETAYDYYKRSTNLVIKKIKRSLFTEEQTRKILNGKMSLTKEERQKYLYSLIKFGYKTCRCDKCGTITQARLSDGVYPLLISFIDKNEKNLHIDNLEIACYNCFHSYIGDIAYSTKFKKQVPLRIENANYTQINNMPNQWDIGWDLDNEMLNSSDFESLSKSKKKSILNKIETPKKELNPDVVSKLRDKFQKNIGIIEKKL